MASKRHIDVRHTPGGDASQRGLDSMLSVIHCVVPRTLEGTRVTGHREERGRAMVGSIIVYLNIYMCFDRPASRGAMPSYNIPQHLRVELKAISPHLYIFK